MVYIHCAADATAHTVAPGCETLIPLVANKPQLAIMSKTQTGHIDLNQSSIPDFAPRGRFACGRTIPIVEDVSDRRPHLEVCSFVFMCWRPNETNQTLYYIAYIDPIVICPFLLFFHSPFSLLHYYRMPVRTRSSCAGGLSQLPVSPIMGVPCTIRASQPSYQDQQSPQYRALMAIAELPDPDRSILGGFLIDARDPQEAGRYFLRVTGINGTPQSIPTKTILEVLSDWKYLVNWCEHS